MHRIVWVYNVNLKIKHNFYSPKNWKTHIGYTWNKPKKKLWLINILSVSTNWIAWNGLAKPLIHLQVTKEQQNGFVIVTISLHSLTRNQNCLCQLNNMSILYDLP